VHQRISKFFSFRVFFCGRGRHHLKVYAAQTMLEK